MTPAASEDSEDDPPRDTSVGVRTSLHTTFWTGAGTVTGGSRTVFDARLDIGVGFVELGIGGYGDLGFGAALVAESGIDFYLWRNERVGVYLGAGLEGSFIVVAENVGPTAAAYGQAGVLVRVGVNTKLWIDLRSSGRFVDGTSPLCLWGDCPPNPRTYPIDFGAAFGIGW